MNNIRILLAEDDNNLGILLKNYLLPKIMKQPFSLTVLMALEAFAAGSFDLCILDIMMPEMDGLTLAKAIRIMNPQYL